MEDQVLKEIQVKQFSFLLPWSLVLYGYLQLVNKCTNSARPAWQKWSVFTKPQRSAGISMFIQTSTKHTQSHSKGWWYTFSHQLILISFCNQVSTKDHYSLTDKGWWCSLFPVQHKMMQIVSVLFTCLQQSSLPSWCYPWAQQWHSQPTWLQRQKVYQDPGSFQCHWDPGQGEWRSR